MERYKKFYKATFDGKIKKNLRIDRFSLEDAMREILEIIPLHDEGKIEVYEIDFNSNRKKFYKKYLVFNELFLTEQESIPIAV